MSWQLPICIGVLYFCLGLLILNTGVFNNHLDPETTTTTTTTISVLSFKPMPTNLPVGYIPYKHSALPWLDSMGAAWIADDSVRREKQKQEGSGVKDGNPDLMAAEMPGCPSGKKSCSALGHPEICCNEEHTCLLTNNTLNGVYCCRSTDPITMPCDETNLQCDPGWYECPAPANGGCCKYNQRCGLLECFEGGGPAAPTTTAGPTTASSVIDTDNDGMVGSEDETAVERTTIDFTPGANTTVTITSTSTSSRTTVPGSKTSYTPVVDGNPTTMIPSETTLNGALVTYTHSGRPGTTSMDSAAGARAKAGHHWSWAVMAWWIVAIIFEGV